MSGVCSKIHKNNDVVYEGNIPSSKLKFTSIVDKNEERREGTVTKKTTDTSTEYYNISVNDADCVFINALDVDTSTAGLGKFSVEGPLTLTFRKGTIDQKEGHYAAGIEEFWDKESMKQSFEKSARESFRSNASYSQTTEIDGKIVKREEIKYDPSKKSDRVKVKTSNLLRRLIGKKPFVDENPDVVNKDVDKEVDAYVEKLSSTLTNFSGHIYFESESDYHAARDAMKSKDGSSMKGIRTGYEVVWYIPHNQKFEVVCQ